MEAALLASEREAHERASREEQLAIADVIKAQEREAAEIAEALRLVEAAMRQLYPDADEISLCAGPWSAADRGWTAQ